MKVRTYGWSITKTFKFLNWHLLVNISRTIFELYIDSSLAFIISNTLNIGRLNINHFRITHGFYL